MEKERKKIKCHEYEIYTGLGKNQDLIRTKGRDSREANIAPAQD